MIFDKATIDLFKKIVSKDGFIDLPAQGNSMFPLIQTGDICRFVICDPWQLMKGEIVLYHSRTGRIIAHRFYEQKTMNYMRYYFLKGDTNLGFDQPINEYQIIGKLTFIQKAEKKISVANHAAALWGRLILKLPVISGMLRKYLNWKSHYQY
ncbi:hypothetical protein CVD25_13050 [Bacillus canaveralius]|uniref:Signal peptidase I n=2 Tax=Bacillus TaxID=1386 RepID=A0A2N5GNF3_9BACI|nr:hypothetical protein [Bacillus canaveralius]PLR84038.1 hypothetical protein CU635_06955 [Bacillus canaveralius]PLR96317.1 hypothetical protein CVD25_13050 [Bacillus canaveralius]